MFDNAVDNYAHALEFFPDCYKALIDFSPRKCMIKMFETVPFVFDFAPDQYITQKLREKGCFLKSFYARILPWQT